MALTSGPSELQRLYNLEGELRTSRNELCGRGGMKALMIDNNMVEVRARIRQLEGKLPYGR